MNLKSLFCGFAAATLLAACSSDEPAVKGSNEGGSSFNGSGFMNVAINLPSQSGSRAANDEFDHGTENEYKVDNAMLILFTGATENDAVFHSAYDLKDMTGENNSTSDKNITSTYTKTIQVNDVADNQVLWGLVLVNYSQVATAVMDESAGFIATLSFNNKAVTKGVTKFTEMNNEITSEALKAASSHFFMTNAPVNANPGGATPVTEATTTLVKLGTPAQCIRPTAEEAEANPAGSFYVERAVAKATLTVAQNPETGSIEAAGLSIKSVEWVIDNTEPTSYIIRNMGDKSYIPFFSSVPATSPNKYRFVGSAAIGKSTLDPDVSLFRTYWCIDPSYNTAKPYTGITDATTLTFLPSGNDAPQYCHENTFDVAHQTYKNTTRAILKVQFTSSNTDKDANGNLYVVANNPEVIYDKDVDAKSHMISAIISQAETDLSAAGVLNPGQSIEINSGNYAQYLDVVWENMDDENVIRLKSVSYKDDPVIYANKPADFTTYTINNLNTYYRYTVYEGGISYYEVRFKHFGDDLTPWAAPDQSADTPDVAYGPEPAASQNYLGRYGMVRNNWYSLNITSFKKLGVPVVNDLNVEEGKDPSDDNKETEKWISFKITILAWALRTQNVDF